MKTKRKACPFDRLSTQEKCTVLGALSVATIQLATSGGESENLAEIAENLDFEPTDTARSLLLELDRSLDARSLLEAIRHLATDIEYRDLGD